MNILPGTRRIFAWFAATSPRPSRSVTATTSSSKTARWEPTPTWLLNIHPSGPPSRVTSLQSRTLAPASSATVPSAKSSSTRTSRHPATANWKNCKPHTADRLPQPDYDTPDYRKQLRSPSQSPPQTMEVAIEFFRLSMRLRVDVLSSSIT